MCGIVGIAGNTLQRDMKIFRDMLIFDQVRGFDSTGVVAVGCANDTPKVEKDLDGPDNLWNNGQSDIFDMKGISRSINKVMIGHNRAATIGNVIVENAHPFEFGDIAGVHNGSLYDWWDLSRKEDGTRFDVDSKALLKNISEEGIEETWKKFTGAASLVWWDKSDGTLNFARNDERPMYLAWNEKADVLFFASEKWMIEVAANRHGHKLKWFEEDKKNEKGQEYKKYFQTYATKTDHYFKFKVTPNSVTLVEDRKLEKKQSMAVGRTTASTTTDGGKTNGHTNTRCNTRWAKGLVKAGRDQVGRAFQFSHTVQRYMNGKFDPYFVGHMLEGEKERVEIYPTTYNEFEDFHIENEKTKHKYVLGSRPRILLDSSKKFFGYAIEVNNIKYFKQEKEFPTFEQVAEQLKKLEQTEPKGEVVHLYKTFGDRMVTEETWRTNIKGIGGCCDFCGQGIALKDHDQCLWYNHGVICPECKDDETYKAYMNAG